MRRFLLTALLLFPVLAFAQSDWVSYQDSGCIGGSTCTDRRLRVALDDRPVIGVRFYAHDAIGEKAEGVLRVKIDGNVVDGYIDIPRPLSRFRAGQQRRSRDQPHPGAVRPRCEPSAR
jgi:hypothetical protein